MPQGVQIHARVQGPQSDILSEPALAFLAALHRTFNPTRLAVRFSCKSLVKQLIPPASSSMHETLSSSV